MSTAPTAGARANSPHWPLRQPAVSSSHPWDSGTSRTQPGFQMQQLGAWSRALRLEWISSHRSHGQNQISHMTPGRNSPVTHSQGFQSGHAAPLQPDTRTDANIPFPLHATSWGALLCLEIYFLRIYGNSEAARFGCNWTAGLKVTEAGEVSRHATGLNHTNLLPVGKQLKLS